MIEIERFVAELHTNSADVNSLKFALKVGIPVDYDRFAPAFAAAYLRVNYHKSLQVLRRLDPGPVTAIADIGCGSGAGALAALTYLSGLGVDAPDSIDLLLVDRCPHQLELAVAVVRPVAAELGLAVDITPVVADCAAPLQGDRKYGLVFAAHVVTENQDSIAAILSTARRLAATRGVVVAIERADDVVVGQLIEALSQHGETPVHGVLDVEVPDDDGRTRRTAWVSTAQPPARWLADLVAGYFSAWREQSVEAVAGVFAKDAIYQDEPHGPGITGLTGIEEYWQREVVPQRDLLVRRRSVTWSLAAASVEWSADFVRDGERYELAGMMSIEADPEDKLICSLREYYRTKRGPERSH